MTEEVGNDRERHCRLDRQSTYNPLPDPYQGPDPNCRRALPPHKHPEFPLPGRCTCFLPYRYKLLTCKIKKQINILILLSYHLFTTGSTLIACFRGSCQTPDRTKQTARLDNTPVIAGPDRQSHQPSCHSAGHDGRNKLSSTKQMAAGRRLSYTGPYTLLDFYGIYIAFCHHLYTFA